MSCLGTGFLDVNKTYVRLNYLDVGIKSQLCESSEDGSCVFLLVVTTSVKSTSSNEQRGQTCKSTRNIAWDGRFMIKVKLVS